VSKKSVIIDCDPGIDDALALLLAFVAPELDIIAITTVCGNKPAKQTLQNALSVCELGGRDELAVYGGCHAPMLRAPIQGQFHGGSGLGQAQLPPPVRQAEPLHAVDFLIQRLKQAARDNKPVTLCCLGPLTNIALALRIEPDIAKGIERLIQMGGAYLEPGNRTMVAEFNILADPHAANVVFSSNIDIVALPLDATHQMMLDSDKVAKFVASSGRLSETCNAMMALWDRNDVQRYGSRGGPLHDPLVIVYLLRPDLFQTRRARLFVNTQNEAFIGQTIADWYGKSGEPANAEIVTKIDAVGIFQFLQQTMKAYTLPCSKPEQGGVYDPLQSFVSSTLDLADSRERSLYENTLAGGGQ